MGGKFIDEQLSLLEESGISVGVLLHGSEIRDPAFHQHFPYSPFSKEDEFTKILQDSVTILKSHLTGLQVPIFVTTPDLLQYIEGEWLPIVIDFDFWTSLPPAPQNPKPTVLHVPSNNQLKGSKYIDQELSQLESEGKIKYLRPEERVSSTSVRSLISQSDIVVDGIVIGAYGVTSCQAMAAGRIVIGNTNELDFLRSECPILHADPSSLRTAVESLIENQSTWDSQISKGTYYVKKYHDGRATAEKLEYFFNN